MTPSPWPKTLRLRGRDVEVLGLEECPGKVILAFRFGPAHRLYPLTFFAEWEIP